MTKQEIEDFVATLTPDQVADITARLIKRERDNARSMAVTMASALEASLRVAGEPLAAEQVSNISRQLLGGLNYG